MVIATPQELAAKALADIEVIALHNMHGNDVNRLQSALNDIHAIARYKMPVPIQAGNMPPPVP